MRPIVTALAFLGVLAIMLALTLSAQASESPRPSNILMAANIEQAESLEVVLAVEVAAGCNGCRGGRCIAPIAATRAVTKKVAAGVGKIARRAVKVTKVIRPRKILKACGRLVVRPVRRCRRE